MRILKKTGLIVGRVLGVLMGYRVPDPTSQVMARYLISPFGV